MGSVVGSFLNVVVDRATMGESIMGRSYCDHCRAKLSSIDLVPIVSFATLGAKCRHCNKQLSWQYPIVETMTATLFALAFWVLVQGGGLSIVTLLFWLLLLSVSVVVAVVDFKFQLIPTSFVYAASFVSLFYNYFVLPSPIFVDHILAAFGVAVFFLLIVLVTRGRGMGQGDIVLVFLIGMVLGIEATVAAMFIAFLTGAVISVMLILVGRKKFGNTVPFAPFLIFGFIFCLFWGKELLGWYFKVLY